MGSVSISSDLSFGACEKQLGTEFATSLWNKLWPHLKYDPTATMQGFTVLSDAKRAGFKPDGFSVGREPDDNLRPDPVLKSGFYTDGGAW